MILLFTAHPKSITAGDKWKKRKERATASGETTDLRRPLFFTLHLDPGQKPFTFFAGRRAAILEIIFMRDSFSVILFYGGCLRRNVAL